MQLKEVEQLLLFHIYHSTRTTKAIFAKPAADLISLMDRYEAGGGVADAALNELWMGNSRITSFQDQNDEDVFKITSSGIREVEDALASPTSVLTRALEKYCPNRLELLKAVGFGDSIPASDRTVRRDDNSAAFDEAAKVLNETIEAIEKANDIGDLTAEERSIVLSQLREGRKLFDFPEIKISAVKATIEPALRWILDKAVGTVVGATVLAALGAIGAAVGLPW
jgi:hypothetical protein